MRRIGFQILGVLGGALVLTLGVVPQRASACGGCFAPSDTVTVVTAHRMAVSVSATETTLWDQFQYAGEPEDFVWVLPIRGETLVELADNAFFEALEQSTRITLQGTFPPLNTFCPDPCGDSLRSGAPSAGGGADAGTMGPVMVYGEAVVGPYETATVGSDDPMALVTWLQDNGYGVPDEILPTIAHYVDQGLNFSVLRLNPNAGVDQMQPVRVTTPGLNPVFPLRMVAAGVVDSVGLELYVFGEGRQGTENFDIVEIDSRDLIYDWDTSSFNYSEVFDQTLADAGGRAWVAEFAQPAESYSRNIDGFRSYDDDGTEHSAAEDFAVVTRTLPNPYLTKLRTDLLVEHLDQDIILEADLGSAVESFIQVDREINRPPEPDCPTTCTDPTGSGPGTPGTVTFGGSGKGDGLCSSTAGTDGGPWLALLAVIGALGLIGLRRRN